MKRGLLALLLGMTICTTTLADVYVMANEAGGEITLTERVCKENKNWLQAYSYGKSAYYKGCWNMRDRLVVVVWQSDATGAVSTRVYSPSDFTKRTSI